MGKKPGQPNKPYGPSALRTQAEAVLVRAPLTETPDRSVGELLHELRVYQIELEMQNEALRESQIALESSRDRYADLYEFAPVGYLTLTRDALISEINLIGSALLGVERSKLIRRRFAMLVSSADRERWYQMFLRALQTGERQSCELELLRSDGSCFNTQLDGLHAIKEGAETVVRLTFTDITRFKEADERYRMVFEQAADGIVITDAETGEIIEINQALADLVGRGRQELIGKPLTILCPPETGDPSCNALLQRSSDKHGTEIETQFLAMDGQMHEVEIKLSVLAMNGRNVEFGIIRNVTERRQALAREQRLRHILDNTMDMILIFEPDTLNLVYMNKGACKAIGYSREEMLGMTPLDVVPLISELEGRAFIAPLVSGNKQTLRFETMLKRKNGKLFPVEAQLQLVREDGDNGLFVAIGRDITSRKFAEDELRRQKNLMWQVIDMDPSMIFVRDEAGRYLLANRALADYYGVDIRNLIGKSDGELNPAPQQASGFLASDREVIDGGHEVTAMEPVPGRDGSQHWYLTVKRPMLQADGSINALGIAADISELKQSGIKLDESYKELQRLALHLENVRAEERAQIARNLHDEMGATLAALKMRVAWLASRLPAGMPQLSAEVGHISELVSDGIKTVRQVVSDLRPNLLDDVGLAAAVKDYVKRFQLDSEIECSLSLPEQNFTLNGDQSVSVFRIIQESLNNVARHAHADKVDIRLALLGEALRLEISDNGIGFDVNHKERTFGLLGIKERALMIGGSAAIESTPGMGTRVSLNIPLPGKPSRPGVDQS